jgi:hypothetical protein
MASTNAEILQAHKEALLKQAKAGKALTAAQLAVIQAEASGYDEDVETYVENLTDLAQILGVTRQTLNNWRKMPAAPKADSAGRHNTAAWIAWRDRNCLKGSETTEDVKEKIRAVRLRNEDLELDIAIKRGEFVEIASLVELLGRFGGDQKRLFVQKLEKEWPSKFPKELQAKAREQGRILCDELCRRLQEIVDKMAAQLAEIEAKKAKARLDRAEEV